MPNGLVRNHCGTIAQFTSQFVTAVEILPGDDFSVSVKRNVCVVQHKSVGWTAGLTVGTRDFFAQIDYQVEPSLAGRT